jgi:hypothetical protein
LIELLIFLERYLVPSLPILFIALIVVVIYARRRQKPLRLLEILTIAAFAVTVFALIAKMTVDNIKDQPVGRVNPGADILNQGPPPAEEPAK